MRICPLAGTQPDVMATIAYVCCSGARRAKTSTADATSSALLVTRLLRGPTSVSSNPMRVSHRRRLASRTGEPGKRAIGVLQARIHRAEPVERAVDGVERARARLLRQPDPHPSGSISKRTTPFEKISIERAKISISSGRPIPTSTPIPAAISVCMTVTAPSSEQFTEA